MIDLNLLKRAVADSEGRPVELGRGALQQIIIELEAGRKAKADAGRTFGLPASVRL
jgi:hypothetical protein